MSEVFGIGVQYLEYLNTTLVDSVGPCYAPWAAATSTANHICAGVVGSLVSGPNFITADLAIKLQAP